MSRHGIGISRFPIHLQFCWRIAFFEWCKEHAPARIGNAKHKLCEVITLKNPAYKLAVEEYARQQEALRSTAQRMRADVRAHICLSKGWAYETAREVRRVPMGGVFVGIGGRMVDTIDRRWDELDEKDVAILSGVEERFNNAMSSGHLSFVQYLTTTHRRRIDRIKAKHAKQWSK